MLDHLHRTAFILAGFVLSGCATTAPPTKTESTPRAPATFDLRVGFVYEEEVHASGSDFTTNDCYWDYLYPEVAAAFAEAHSFPTRWEALNADVDLILLGESLVYGQRDRFKYSLTLRAMTLKEKTVLREAIQQRTFSLDDCGETFAGMGNVLYKALTTSARMHEFARSGGAAGLDSKIDRSKSPWAK